MDEQKEKTISADIEIENMRDFLLENQDIKLENLPRYEDIIAPKTQTDVKLDNMKEVNTLPFFETKSTPKPEIKPNNNEYSTPIKAKKTVTNTPTATIERICALT